MSDNRTRETPTQELGRALCFTRLGIAVMNRYVFGDDGLTPLRNLAAELQKHLDAAQGIAPEKRAFGQAHIDALRAALARVEALDEHTRQLDRQVLRDFPAYQLGPSVYTDPNPATLGATGYCTR